MIGTFIAKQSVVAKVLRSKKIIFIIAAVFIFAINFEIEFLDKLKYLIVFLVIFYFSYELNKIKINDFTINN